MGGYGDDLGEVWVWIGGWGMVMIREECVCEQVGGGMVMIWEVCECEYDQNTFYKNKYF